MTTLPPAVPDLWESVSQDTITSGVVKTVWIGGEFFTNGSYTEARTATKNTLLSMGLGNIRGRTIVSATLEMELAEDTVSAQTVTVAPLAGKFTKDTKWGNQPDARVNSGQSAYATVAIPANAKAGQRYSADVTKHAQAVAAGWQWYGWRISTSNSGASTKFNSFQANTGHWRLVIVFANRLDAPTGLWPDGFSSSSGVVCKAKPTLTWDPIGKGAAADQDAYQVQVDTPAAGANPSGSAPKWDSGEQTDSAAECDLEALGGPSTNAAPTASYWRVRVKANGRWSEWSDWASFSYRAQVTGNLTTPTAGKIGDPSPTLAGSIGSGQLTYVQLRVLTNASSGDGWEEVRYEGRRIKQAGGTTFSEQVPARLRDGTRVMADDRPYTLIARLWTAKDRVSTPGAPAWIEVKVNVFLDDDLGDAINLQSVSDDGLSVPTVQWTVPGLSLSAVKSTYKAFAIYRDGVLLDRVATDEFTASPFVWRGDEFSVGYRGTKTWTVRAVKNNGQRTPPSNGVDVTPEPFGVWLICPKAGVRVCLADDGESAPSWTRTWRQSVLTLMGRRNSVAIVHNTGTVGGEVTGYFSDDPTEAVGAAAVVADLEKLDKYLGRNPGALVYLVAADYSKPVRVWDLYWGPSEADGLPFDGNRQHVVKFSFEQVGDF